MILESKRHRVELGQVITIQTLQILSDQEQSVVVVFIRDWEMIINRSLKGRMASNFGVDD